MRAIAFAALLIFAAGCQASKALPEHSTAAVDCRKVATDFGRFAAAAESLCEAHRGPEESEQHRCIAECLERCVH